MLLSKLGRILGKGDDADIRVVGIVMGNCRDKGDILNGNGVVLIFLFIGNIEDTAAHIGGLLLGGDEVAERISDERLAAVRLLHIPNGLEDVRAAAVDNVCAPRDEFIDKGLLPLSDFGVAFLLPVHKDTDNVGLGFGCGNLFLNFGLNLRLGLIRVGKVEELELGIRRFGVAVCIFGDADVAEGDAVNRMLFDGCLLYTSRCV